MRPHDGARAEDGQSLIEFALVFPLLFVLIVNVVNFGAFFFAWITVTHAARSGAQYMVMGGATVNSPSPPSANQIAALIASDAASLPNQASLQVRVCTRNNGVVSCVGPGSGTPPADPEPVFYVLATVDVTYTYQPIIPLWEFPNLNVHATLPPTTIHKRTVMRMLQ
ncbi:MAG: TadE/TadG family type IV pilus assembly protein [Bryobacteraceae bacterium]